MRLPPQLILLNYPRVVLCQKKGKILKNFQITQTLFPKMTENLLQPAPKRKIDRLFLLKTSLGVPLFFEKIQYYPRVPYTFHAILGGTHPHHQAQKMLYPCYLFRHTYRHHTMLYPLDYSFSDFGPRPLILLIVN